ncbi:MAG TPA: hypothetical protein P5531_02595 [Bacteroidales bacterium]|nr:hypothetical protein [Bacteroidales bacterium]HSA43183.1 hypothetical protein [Bacteroidales bacterium]
MNTIIRNEKWAGLLVLVMLVSTVAFSQGRGYGRGDGPRHGWREHRADSAFGPGSGYCMNIPDLTKDQQEKIGKSRLQYDKEALQLKNQRDELKARLRTLQTADKADNKAIDQVIDEIAAINARLAKKRNLHRQEIRSLLTDEQKLWFDTAKGKKGKRGKGPRSQGPAAGERGPWCPW